VVAAYHQKEIPDNVQAAINNLNASAGHRSKNRERVSADKLSIETSATRSIQQPVPIPHAKGTNGQYQPRSYSPSAIYLPSSDRSPPRSSSSSKDSNSSGSPPSSGGSRRRDYDFEGSERSSNSPTSPVRSSSQDSHTMAMASRPSSSLQNRRGESPIGGGKRRSNSDPKSQSPPSAYGYDRAREMGQGRERDRDSVRDKDRDSPTQSRFKPAPATSVPSNSPYSNPQSPASSSTSKLSYAKSTPTPTPAFRVPGPPPRAREMSGPSITSVMASMSLNQQTSGVSPTYVPGSNTASAITAQAGIENPMKRGVIPLHVRKAASVTSSSSSSTNSSAREGTVISDGAFTDYVRLFFRMQVSRPITYSFRLAF
jgi:hypothetical protein